MEDDRIRAVGTRDEVGIPSNAHVVLKKRFRWVRSTPHN